MDLAGLGGGLCGHARAQGPVRPPGHGTAAVRGGGGSRCSTAARAACPACRTMPPDLPDRLEAGTHNMPGIAGLLEGIRFVRRQGMESIAARERQLALRAAPGPGESAGGPRYSADGDFRHQTGVLSFRDGGPGLRGGGGGPGPAGHRPAGGASLRAPGPPHGGDPGHRHRAAEPVRFSTPPDRGGPPACRGSVPGMLRENVETLTDVFVAFSQ